MKIAAFLKTTAGKAITVGGATVVAVGITAAVLMQGEGFRSISVQEVAGTVSIVGEKNNGQAYIGEHLYSGDDVTVGDASELTMCMDNDKYVYADANTHFMLEASAAKDDSRIKIYLDAGSELNELQSKLDPNDTYEVDTPNSTMAVRGTKFRVTVYKAKDGMVYALTEIKDGEVLVRLKTTEGTYNGVEKTFTPGQSALIRGNSDFSEFVTSSMLDNADLSGLTDEDTVLMLAYDSLPEDGLERLIALLENGGLIEETDETEDEIKTQAALRPTPMPTLKPTPSPTPSPGPTGPSQEELLMQLMALLQTTPSPTPEYIPTDDDDEEESSEYYEAEATPEPSPTGGETEQDHSYDPDTGIVTQISSGIQVAKVENGKIQFYHDAATQKLTLLVNGTSYSITNGSVDLANSDPNVVYNEDGLNMTKAISTARSFINTNHQININAMGVAHQVYTSGAGDFHGTSNGDIDLFNQFLTSGDGEYSLNSQNNNWTTATVSGNNITINNNNINYTNVTGLTYTKGASITGEADDPNNAGQRITFTIDSAGDFSAP